MNEYLSPLRWHEDALQLLDQRLLPTEEKWLTCRTHEEVAHAIKVMVVRGAPAIGCTAALGMALGARGIIADSRESFLRRVTGMADTFRAARPTAVNLFWAVDRIVEVVENTEGNPVDMKDAMLAEALEMLAEDIEANRRMGQYGAELMPDNGNVLTHCNAGALAAVGYGMALGVIRAAVEEGKKIHVYADETRPRLQGMKLTAWELAQDNIPVTVIADNMAASLMRQGKVDCVIVGADRIAANGDTANKIGTYGLAVLAKHHNIPFYVAAPFSTIDMKLVSGSQIPIEQRETVEMTHIEGIRVAPEGITVLNPAFDITPGELITAIITERGVIEPPFEKTLEAAAPPPRESVVAAA